MKQSNLRATLCKFYRIISSPIFIFADSRVTSSNTPAHRKNNKIPLATARIANLVHSLYHISVPISISPSIRLIIPFPMQYTSIMILTRQCITVTSTHIGINKIFPKIRNNVLIPVPPSACELWHIMIDRCFIITSHR